jgi:hypothetical protein
MLVLLAVLGGAAGWFIEVWQVAVGHPAPVPPWTFGVVLALIGVIIVLYAIPVWRVASGRTHKRVDPFYATRVVLLAKASSLTGALVGGAALGVLVYLLSRPVIAGVESVSLAIVTVVGAAVLLTGGLIAEKMCTLPPDDDQKQDSTTVAPRT